MQFSTGKETGWTPVRSGVVVVSDIRENTLSIDTSTGKTGYVGTKWLRNAPPIRSCSDRSG